MFGMMTTAGGECVAFPDTCTTPATPPVPIPYPNIAMGSDGSGAKKVSVGNKAVLRKGDSIRMSSGDEAGNSPGGLVSAKFKGKGEILLGWMQVKAEGKDVGYHTSLVGQNGASTQNMPAGVNVSPSQSSVQVTVSPGLGGGEGSDDVPALRLEYEAEVKKLREEADARLAAGESEESVARAMHQKRRDLGVKYKNITPEELRETIYARNLEKYGDPLGPTIDYLSGKGKTWTEIIDSACRPGGKDLYQAMKALG